MASSSSNLVNNLAERIHKIKCKGIEITKAKTYRVEFIDNTRFMASSSSNLVNNLAEGIHKIKCKYKHDDKKC